MGNSAPTKDEQMRLKVKVVQWISMSQLENAVKRMQATKSMSYNDVQFFLNQEPVCTNVDWADFSGGYHYVKYFTNKCHLTFNHLLRTYFGKHKKDIQIGINQKQKSILEQFIHSEIFGV